MQSMIEKITANEEIIAIVTRAGFNPKGVNFLTPENFPLQMAVSSYKKGGILKAHSHPQKNRIIIDAQEMVHIQTGKVELYLFDANGKLIRTLVLEKGDTVFFAAGGHGWKTLEDTKIIEVKQGPYFGLKQDKTYIGDLQLNNNKNEKSL
ncbi:MAG: hypothetical protein ACFFCW_07080 [Candidatus Hodarchaeota archaeon]